MRRGPAVLSLGALAAAGLGAWALGRDATAGVALAPDDPEVVALGRAVHAAQCAACHRAGLEGQPDWRSPGSDGLLPAPPHDETGHTWHHPDAVLFALTREGPAAYVGGGHASAMPGFGDALGDALGDEEIVAVLSFIKSTWPKDVRARHDAIDARAGG